VVNQSDSILHSEGLMATRLTRGVLVVGVAEYKSHTLVLHAYRSGCGVDNAFGRNGTARVVYPGQGGMSFLSSITSDGRGGFFVDGSQNGQWFIGDFGASGHLVASFGHGGWVTLTPPGPVDTGLSASAGTMVVTTNALYVSGSNDQAHCCVQSYVSEVTRSGVPVNSFGADGWVAVLPVGGFVANFFLLANGNLGLGGSVVYGGCGDSYLEELTPSGQPVAGFSPAAALANFELPNDISIVTAYPSGSEMGLIGEVVAPCDGNGPYTQFGETALLTAAGTLGAGSGQRLPYVEPETVTVVPVSKARTLVAFESYGRVNAPQALVLREFSVSGASISSFGHNGSVSFAVSAVDEGDDQAQEFVLGGPHGSVLVLVGSSHHVVIEQLAL
jgi:hypothetical protein